MHNRLINQIFSVPDFFFCTNKTRAPSRMNPEVDYLKELWGQMEGASGNDRVNTLWSYLAHRDLSC